MWRDDDYKIMNILDNIEIKGGECFPVKCPICGKKEGHLYFHRYEIDGDRGGVWTWCSACRHSAHASFKLPKWWKNLEVISFDKLTSFPNYLEDNKVSIDKWINELLSLNRKIE